MKRWVYRCVDMSTHPLETEHRLNRLGADGWELVLVFDNLLWLKRPVEDNEPPAFEEVSCARLLEVLTERVSHVDMRKARSLRGVIQFSPYDEDDAHLYLDPAGWRLCIGYHGSADVTVCGIGADIVELLNGDLKISSQRLTIHGRLVVLGTALRHLRPWPAV